MTTTRFCGLCGKPPKSAPADVYCEGCKTVICELHADAPWGEHDPEDHRECSVCGEGGHFDGECPE